MCLDIFAFRVIALKNAGRNSSKFKKINKIIIRHHSSFSDNVVCRVYAMEECKTTLWVFQKTSEQVCAERGLANEYKSKFVWQSIYHDNFWQVQQKHFLGTVNLSPGGNNNIEYENLFPICTCGEEYCVLCTELPFRILVVFSKFNFVVCQATDEHEIKLQLQYLSTTVTPMLDELNREKAHKEKIQSTSSPTSKKKSADQTPTLFVLVLLKIRALIEQQYHEKTTVEINQANIHSYFDIPLLPNSVTYCWDFDFIISFLFLFIYF